MKLIVKRKGSIASDVLTDSLNGLKLDNTSKENSERDAKKEVNIIFKTFFI